MIKKSYLFLTLLTAFLLGGTGLAWGATQVLSEGFEGSDFDSKWEKRSCNSSSQVYSSAAYGGSSYGFRFYYNTTPPQYLISKSELSIPAGAEVKVSLYYRGSGSSYNETFHVGYSTTDNQTASFIWSDEIASNKTTTWKEYINENFPSETKYIAFKYTANDQYYLYIDDIVVSYTIPSCPKPALSLDETDVNSATFSWTQGGTEEQWQYLYLPAATTLTDSHWDAATLTNSKSATISGLTSGSKYTFYVRSYCSAGDQSKPASITFRADCSKLSIPTGGWTYGFETADGASAGSIPNCWIGLAPIGVNYPTISSSYVKEGSYKLQFQGKSADAPQYIVLPEFEVPVQNLKLTFWYRRDGDYSYTSKPQVGYFTTNDPEVNSEFVSIGTAGSISTTYTSYTVDFKDAPVTAKRIAIKFTGATYTSYTGGLFVDNIKVESTQDCSKPATPTYSALTGNSVTINWTANAGVTDYKYINVDRTANPSYVLDWENDASPVTGTSVALGELVDGHNYEFYVMCACGTVASDACTYQPLSCPNVTEVSLSNQLWNGVTINWTTSATTNCDVQYKAGSGEWQTAETNTSATSKVISGLSVGTEYSFRVKPNCSADGWISSASTYTPACPALGALSLSGQTYNGVTVSWSAVAGISSWNLRYRKGSDSWTEVNNIAALTYTIASGLVTNEEYTIELYSECGGSAASTTYTPVYEIPAVLTASPVKDVTATLNWSTVDGASGYQYSCVKTGQADAWSATQVANSVALSGLEAAEEYTAKVRAVFGGSNYSDPKEKVFSTVCQAPVSLVKGETSSSSLAFSWSKSAEGNADNRYQYVCKAASSAPTADEWSTNGVLLDEGVRTVTVEGLSANTTYYFFVRSYYGADKYSSALSGNNKTDCGIVNIGWSETFGSTAGTQPSCWTIEKWGTSANYWTTANDYAHSGSALRYNAKTLNNSAVISPSIYIAEKCTLCFYVRNSVGSGSAKVECQVFINDGTSDTEITNLTTNVSGTISSVNTRHTTATAKYYDLSSFVGKTITIRFLGKGYDSGTTSYLWIDDVSINYKPISAPTLAAPVATTDGAIVNWTHDEDGPFDLRYRVNGAEPEAEWIEVNTINDKTKTLTGLAAGTEYEVQVRANISAHRISTWTASKAFTPECVAPVGIDETAHTYNSVSLAWTGDAKTIRYKKGSDEWTSDAFDPAKTSYTVSGLVTGEEYTIQVQAACATVDDKWSEAFLFTPACGTPTALAVVAESETQTGAQISWTAGNGEAEWKVQYKKEGDADYTTLSGITANPYTFTGLTAGTHYYARVAAACNDSYTDAVEFNTVCPANFAMPFEQDFNGLAAGIPLCWDNSEGTTTVEEYKWNSYATGHEGKCVRFDSYDNNTGYSLSSNTNFLKTPAIAVTETANLEFWFKNPTGGDFSVFYSLDGGETKEPLATGLTGVSDWTKKKIELPAACVGENVTICFKGTSNWSTSSLAYIYIDDVKVAAKPACQAPTDVVVSDMTKNSASISWTNGGEETYWKLQYKAEGDAHWSNANSGAAFTSKPFELTGLDARTVYYVRVKAVCDPANEVESDEWSVEGSFKTDCDYLEIAEFSEVFSSTLPECWKLAKVGENDWYAAGSYADYYMEFNSQTAEENYADLITPFVELTDDANLKFSLWNSSYLGAVTAEVLVDNGTETVKLVDLGETSGWQLQTLDLATYTGQRVRFIFRAHGTAAESTRAIRINDVVVEIKPCDAPAFTAANVAVTADGAVISCAADQWNLQYRTNGAGDWTQVENLTAASYTLTGLTSGTTYEVQVQTVCSATRKSAWTASQTFTPQCLAPTALTAAPAINSAAISWTGEAGKLQYREFAAEEPFNAWTSVPFDPAKESHTISGLTANTKYDVRVQAACAATEEAAWTSITSFTTWCDSKLSLPVNLTSFSAIPACWEESPAGAVSFANSKLCFVGEGERFLYLPQTDVNLNLLSATFTFSGSLEFGYIDAPNGAFQAFESQPTSGVELNMEGEVAAAKYIAIRYNGASNLSQASISAVSIRKTPTCLKPTGVAGTPGVGSASISWTENGSAEAWNLQYKTGSADWTTVAVTENPYALSGLEYGVSYKVRVQAACAGEDPSDWSDEAEFTTDCAAIAALPWYADFSVALSACWTIHSESSSSYKPAANTAMNQLNMDGGKNGSSNNVVVLPAFSADLSDAVLSLEYKNGSAGANYAKLEIGYVTDKNDASTFVIIGEAWEQSTSFTEARVALADVTTGRQIAFRFAGASTQSDMSIKNLRILEQLTLADNANNSAILASHNGKAADVVIGRTIVCADYYNTICLPFNLPTLDGTPLEGGDLWAFKYAKVDEATDELLFRIIEADHIEAGKPYFIQFAAGDAIENPLFKNVTISATAGQEVGNDVAKLCGIIDQPVVFNAGDQTKLFLAANNTLYWWKGSANSQLNNFRAYFKVATGGAGAPARHGMRARIIKQEEAATGINNNNVENVTLKFIENNQVVIIRNGVKYNIQGQVISK